MGYKASRLKMYLVEHGISLKALSIETGIPATTLSKICNGRDPRISSVISISQALGVHPTKIFPDIPYEQIKRNMRRSS